MGFRLRFWVLRVVALAVALGVCLAPAVARAATVVNGGFETGDFTGWHEQDQAGSAGSWQVYSGTSSPLNGFTIPAPPQGMFAAITDQTNPASNILYQDVALEAGAKHTLSLYVYYTSQAPIANPPTLDYTTSFPNQQFRIDVMKPSAPLTSVNPSDILLTVFATKTGDPESLSPTLIKVDLTPFAGQTVRLRFAQVDNQFFSNAGFDDVTIASTPAATTAPASGLTVGSATLNGTVNPAGSETSYHFEYGTTTAYGTSVPVPAAAVGSDSTVHSVSQAISGLSPGTTYHYRIVATNDNGTTDGADMTFTTTAAPPKAVPPTVTTGAASNLAHTSATLHGRVNPNGSATSYHFQYGTSTHFGKQTSVKSAGSGTITQSASASISGLARGHDLPLPDRRGQRGGNERRRRSHVQDPCPPAEAHSLTSQGSGRHARLRDLQGDLDWPSRRGRRDPPRGPQQTHIARRQDHDLPQAAPRDPPRQRHQTHLPHNSRINHRHRCNQTELHRITRRYRAATLFPRAFATARNRPQDCRHEAPAVSSVTAPAIWVLLAR